MKKWLQKFPFLKNRYLLVLLLLFLWMLFFDRNGFYQTYRQKQQLRNLRHDKDYFKNEIDRLKAEREALANDKEALEKFAREEYKMKKPDEDLFIVEDEKGAE